jgi:cytochrome P450
MENTALDVAVPAGKPSILLTSRRDPRDRVRPSPALMEAQASGAWPPMDYWHPEYPTELFHTRAVTRYDEVRQVLSDENIEVGLPKTGSPGSFGNQPGVVVYSNGDSHRRLRRAINGFFTRKRIESLRPSITAIVNELLDRLEDGDGSADLLADFALPFPAQVICEMLGVPFEDRSTFESWARHITSLTLTSDEMLAIIKSMHDYVADIVERYHREPAHNLISGLISDFGHELSDEEITGLAMNLFVGGQDTTAYAIAVGVIALLERPEQLVLVRDDAAIVPQAVEEIVRYLALVPSPHNRIVKADTTIGDKPVRAGDRLIVSILAANSDPDLVGDSPDFDVSRKRVAHLGFGYGKHQCVGQHLARLELQVAIPAILQRFPTMQLAVDRDEIEWRSEYARIYGLQSAPIPW